MPSPAQPSRSVTMGTLVVLVLAVFGASLAYNWYIHNYGLIGKWKSDDGTYVLEFKGDHTVTMGEGATSRKTTYTTSGHDLTIISKDVSPGVSVPLNGKYVVTGHRQ